MKKNLLTLIISVVTTSTTQAALQCQDLVDFTKTQIELRTNPSEEASKVLNYINNLMESPAYKQSYFENANPRWQQYSDLVLLREMLQQSKLTKTEKENIPALYRNLSEKYEQLLNEKMSDSDFLKKYTDYLDNNYFYFKLTENINKILGGKIFPSARFDLVVSNEKTIEQAETILKEKTENFEKNFSLTGHKTHEEYRNFLKNLDPETAKLLNDIDSHLYVTIQRPESARFWLPLSGFQNQRTTGTSKGAYDPSGRDNAESNYLNMPDYSNYSSRFKVKNMAAHISKKDTGLTRDESSLGHYGPDYWIIKNAVLTKRATFTIGNSLDLGRALNNTSKLSVLNQSIPWKFKDLIVAFTSQRAQNSIFAPSPYVKPDPKFNLNDFAHLRTQNYFEVQVLGDLSLDHIEALHFKGNPPDKKFADLLKSKNIKIFDARGEFPIEYEAP